MAVFVELIPVTGTPELCNTETINKVIQFNNKVAVYFIAEKSNRTSMEVKNSYEELKKALTQ